jgi:hypothetical protein
MTDQFCAECDEHVPAGLDHVKVETNMMHLDDPWQITEWVMHIKCYHDLEDSLTVPE